MDKFLVYTMIFLPIFIFSIQGQDEESLIAEIQLADMELQDDCESTGLALKSSLITNNYTDWIYAQKHHANVLTDISDTLKTYSYVPFQVERNWTTLVKSGDSLLVNEDLNTLMSFYAGNEELMLATKVHCDNDKPQKCPVIKEVYEEILQTRRNKTLLKKSWSVWQNLLYSKRKDFPSVLRLVQKAALQNEQTDAKSYWEMLVDLEDAYEKANTLWDEIQPLYLKLRNFVKTRIFKFHNIYNDSSSEIPVYLLGSNYGYDWSHVADIVLPHPQIHYNAKTFLKRKSIKDIYRLAEDLTKELSLGTLGEDFWRKSNFNMPLCESHVISFCSQEHSEVLTCNKTSWVAYLDSFEKAIDIAVRNTNYLTFPRSRLRYSVIDEAIKSLGSTLAITNMRFNGILNKTLFSTEEDDTNRMTELLLVALRVLPQLPFYLAADKWRLDAFENGFQELDQTWWKYRKNLQGVKGVFNNESDYLGESYIISNRPYVSKFFGIILQFQLLQYYKLEMRDLQGNVASHIGQDESFLSMIRDRLSAEWPDVVDRHLYISELFATPLLDYFQPLESYLDSAPLEQQPVTTEPPEPVVKIVVISKEKKTEPKNLITTLQKDNDTNPRRNIKKSSNEDKDKLIVYLGVGIFVAVMGIVVVSKVVKRKKTNINRRFDT